MAATTSKRQPAPTAEPREVAVVELHYKTSGPRAHVYETARPASPAEKTGLIVTAFINHDHPMFDGVDYTTFTLTMVGTPIAKATEA